MAQTIPTANRMALLGTKKRIKLARKGHKLLKEKRDALISEFFKIIDELKQVRVTVEAELKEAYRALILAQAADGISEVRRAASISQPLPKINQTSKAIMGLKVPLFSWDGELDIKPGYSLVSTSSSLDIAAQEFAKVLATIVKIAELEAATRMIAEDIKKTKRKVNALERILIPRLDDTRKYISMRLEEMAREEFGRLKMIKAKVTAE